jgi:hypothetical protein
LAITGQGIAADFLPQIFDRFRQADGSVLERWTGLTRFLDNPCIPLDNNAAERALRGVAVGRKNYLFAGSDRGGERAAAIYSLIETAKLNGRDPEAWLRDVLARQQIVFRVELEAPQQLHRGLAGQRQPVRDSQPLAFRGLFPVKDLLRGEPVDLAVQIGARPVAPGSVGDPHELRARREQLGRRAARDDQVRRIRQDLGPIGLGQALFEEFTYDPDGNPLTLHKRYAPYAEADA